MVSWVSSLKCMTLALIKKAIVKIDVLLQLKVK